MKTQFFWFICICIAPVFLISIAGCGEEIVEDEEITAEATVEIAPPPEGMVLVPAGEFGMGKNIEPILAPDGSVLNEYVLSAAPLHTVYVDAFYMDKYEVTLGQYAEFLNAMLAAGHNLEAYDWGSWSDNFADAEAAEYIKANENNAVGGVSWYGAMAYAAWAGKRLPTEAEWEKAARGGLEGFDYPWGGDIEEGIDDTYVSDRIGGPVGERLPNGYGLYDMAGNVQEWCLDEYDPDFYANSPPRNPLAGAISIEWLIDNAEKITTKRVLRGGSGWGSIHVSNLVWSRMFYREPSDHDAIDGFRCVKDISP